MDFNKPTVVICCSEHKLSFARSLDIYKEGLAQQVRSHALRCGYGDALDMLNVVILSAYYGFCEGFEMLSEYNVKMTDHDSVDSFINSNSGESGVSITETAEIFNNLNPDLPLYVCLPNEYLSAWDRMVDLNIIKSNKLPHQTYISRGHVGILQLKSRLKMALNTIFEETTSPLFFRSGVASMPELGYLDAGEAIGTSLAHCNVYKSVKLKNEILEGAKTTKVFWDNGLITMHNQGKEIDTDWVFEQYSQLMQEAGLQAAKNISVVIPDAPFSESNALNIIARHKEEIIKLTNQCDVILPVHKYDDPAAFAYKALQTLDFPENIRLGVPCLEKTGLDLMLPHETIESLFNAKRSVPSPTAKNPDKIKKVPLFSSVHYFGLSDATAPSKIKPRLQLAEMYFGLNTNSVTLDACRTTALFGRGRKGSLLQNELIKESDKNVIKVVDYHHEVQYDTGAEIWMEDFWALLDDEDNTESINAWYEIVNHLYDDSTYFTSSIAFDEHDLEGSIERAWAIFAEPLADRDLFERWRAMNLASFKYAKEINLKLTPVQARRLAICKIFTDLKNGQSNESSFGMDIAA
ncbi:hypothetical protein [Vibrio sp. 10N.239.312.D08]|uniref:hypothetical protein n=1 Tax=Vibrio sp. 10N.239.312.D08 TaxID=3229978 RepID=UPI003550360C